MIDVALVVVPKHLRKHTVCSHTEIATSQITKIGKCLTTSQYSCCMARFLSDSYRRESEI
jgi:hypothetical protein